jgi:phospholipid/cholesterol/gamma-HCH transport system substrate-binding protein
MFKPAEASGYPLKEPRMITKEQKVRVGVFFLVGIILVTALFFISFGRSIFRDEKIYHIKFENTSVSGLETGGNVKYHGINVGEIERIEVSEEDISDVVVTISVDEDTPIKKDMEANLVMMGITGLKQIELSGGTNRSEDLPEGGYIETGTSAIADITGEAQVIADKVELLVNNLNNFASTANQQAFSDILANTDYLLEENRDNITRAITQTAEITSNLQTATADLRVTAADIRETVEGEQIDEILGKITAVTDSSRLLVEQLRGSLSPERLDRITANLSDFTDMMKGEETQQLLQETGAILAELKTILEQTDETSQLIDMTVLKSSRDLVEAIESLNETMENLNEFSRIISEDPSRLIEF